MKRKIASVVTTAKAAVPEGTGVVGAGLVVAALCGYIFVVIALNALDGDAKAAFSAFWAVVFVIGPGFFLPLEQEVGRALAHRRVQQQGGRPVVARAAQIGGAITVVLIIATLALSGVLGEHLFNGYTFLSVALAASLIGFLAAHLSRGVLAGEGRFRPYGELIGLDAVLRLVLVIALVVIGVSTPGWIGMCIAVSPLLALPIALRSQRKLLQPGPPAPVSELSVNIGWLLAASVFMQALAYSPLLGINILGGDSETEIVAGFASAFFIARVPVLAYQSVQGTLLPKLAGLAGSGRHDEFRRGMTRLLTVVTVIGVVGAVGAFFVGVPVGEKLFNDFTMGAGGLALLTAGSGAFIFALTLAQALMALGAHRLTAVSWGVGLIIAVAVMIPISDLELRVDLGFLVGCIAAAIVMGIGLQRRQRQIADGSIGNLITAIEQDPIEL